MRSLADLARQGRRLPGRLRRVVGADDRWALLAPRPGGSPPAPAQRWCCICRWEGSAFLGGAHCEEARCPRCGSIARDRFLFASFARRRGAAAGRKTRVLETSPRLGHVYRRAMGRWFDYTASDFDERGHRAEVRLDLQDIELPDGSLDEILSSHVLEHVPDTDRALAELRRVLSPGGSLYLQVPLLQGRTAPPAVPEFHGDDTPVFWRFGWDLVERMEAAGFTTTPLIPATFFSDEPDVPPPTGEFDIADILDTAPRDRLVVLGDQRAADQEGFRPGYMFATFEGVAAG